MLRLRAARTVLAIWIGLTVSLISGRFGAVTLARMHTPSASSLPAATECEGDACSQVTVTFDEAKQQYIAPGTTPRIGGRG
jgi:hypothetical protein